jgi:hypothetical protein
MTTMQQMDEGQANAHVVFNENCETLSATAIFGKDPDTTTGLVWGALGGLYNGNTKAAQTVTQTDSSDNYVVVLRSTGVVSVSTSSANSLNTLYAKLYKNTCAGGVVTVSVDQRLDANGLLFATPAAATTLAALTDTDVAGSPSPVNGQVLTFNSASGKWVASTPSSAPVTSVNGQTGVVSLALSSLSDIDTAGSPSPIAGQVLTWNQALSKWQASTPSSGVTTLAALTDVDVAGSPSPTNGQVLTWNSANSKWQPSTVSASSTVGRHAIFIAAGSISPSVSGGCAAVVGIASAASQPDIRSLDFDTTTQEYAQFAITMPKSWNEGTVTFAALWSHAATTTNFGVVWDLQGYAASDDDAIATAFGTAQTSTDTGGTTNDIYMSPESAAITIAGSPAAQDTVFFRLSRVTGNGSDTMAIDARLMGIVLYITTDADTDA